MIKLRSLRAEEPGAGSRLIGTAGPISGYLERTLRASGLQAPANILDVPSGFGRHSAWLADQGFCVTAVDISGTRLTICANADRLAPAVGSISPVLADANLDLPFQFSSFDVAIIIHFVSAGLVRRITPLLRPHGLLVYESFGAQGENWRGLPRPGALRAELGEAFDVLDYRERIVGPQGNRAAVVKFAARRRPDHH